MSDPPIDESYLDRTTNLTTRLVPIAPTDGILRYIGLHECENPAYRARIAPYSPRVAARAATDPHSVLEYNLTSGPERGKRGSANWYVDYYGGLHHYVLEERYIAWHAGASRWADVAGTDYQLKVARLSIVSIGVEVDLPGDGTPPAPLQWAALCWLVEHLCAYWHIPLDSDHLWEHKAVALPPGRKHDPEGFSKARLLAALGKG